MPQKEKPSPRWRRRLNGGKISYGKLVADTTEYERSGIIREYCAEKRRKGRKKG